MKSGILFIMMILAFLFSSCSSFPDVAPDNSGAVVDTQATIAAGAASLSAGASNLDAEAAGIAGALGTMAQANPALVPVAARAGSHAEATKAYAVEARKHEADVMKARLEVVAVVARAARAEGLYQEERVGRVKAEGDRNKLLIILFGSIVLVGVWVLKKG